MLTRDNYIALLEKRAAEETAVDSQEMALSERNENRSDSRAQLDKLFANTGAVEKNQSKEVSKLFPGKSEKEPGPILMKIAQRAFDQAVLRAEGGVLKTASAEYRAVAFRSFCSELEKIASAHGG